MDSKLTASKAVLIGHLIVNVPVVCIMGVGYLLAYVLKGRDWAVIGILVGVVPAWFWWSFMIPRWREWAKGQGADELQMQNLAQRSGLVWSKGSIFEKTEFRPRKRT